MAAKEQLESAAGFLVGEGGMFFILTHISVKG